MGAFDGNLARNRCCRRDSPGLAQWNGYLNQDITLQNHQFVENFASTEQVWVSTGGSAPRCLGRPVEYRRYAKGHDRDQDGRNVLINGNTCEGWEVGFTVTSRNGATVKPRVVSPGPAFSISL
jgi:hypothetical protein